MVIRGDGGERFDLCHTSCADDCGDMEVSTDRFTPTDAFGPTPEPEPEPALDRSEFGCMGDRWAPKVPLRASE